MKLVNKELRVVRVHQVKQVPVVNQDSKVKEVLMEEMVLQAVTVKEAKEDQLVNEALPESEASMVVMVEMDEMADLVS